MWTFFEWFFPVHYLRSRSLETLPRFTYEELMNAQKNEGIVCPCSCITMWTIAGRWVSMQTFPCLAVLRGKKESIGKQKTNDEVMLLELYFSFLSSWFFVSCFPTIKRKEHLPTTRNCFTGISNIRGAQCSFWGHRALHAARGVWEEGRKLGTRRGSFSPILDEPTSKNLEMNTTPLNVHAEYPCVPLLRSFTVTTWVQSCVMLK